MYPTNTLFLFDIDDTITDSGSVGSQCFAKAFRQLYGVESISIDWREYPHVTDWGLTNSAIEQHLGRRATTADYHMMESRYNELLHQSLDSGDLSVKEVPGARAFLQHLRDLGCVVGFATGGWSYSARLKLDAAAVPHHGINIASSDLAWSRADIMEASISHHSATHAGVERVVYFGDGHWDVATCRALGVPMVGVDFRGTKGLQGLGVDPIITGYQDPDYVVDAVHALLSI